MLCFGKKTKQTDVKAGKNIPFELAGYIIMNFSQITPKIQDSLPLLGVSLFTFPGVRGVSPSFFSNFSA